MTRAPPAATARTSTAFVSSGRARSPMARRVSANGLAAAMSRMPMRGILPARLSGGGFRSDDVGFGKLRGDVTGARPDLPEVQEDEVEGADGGEDGGDIHVAE